MTDDVMRRAVEAAASVLLGRVNAPEQEIYRAAETAIRAALPIVAEEWLAIVDRWSKQDEIDNGHVATDSAGYALAALRARLAEMLEEKADGNTTSTGAEG